MRHRILTLCLCLCLLLGAIPLAAYAAATVTGTVTGIDAGSKLYVRKSPSLSATILDKLDNGATVTILDTTKAEGITWYKVTTAAGKTGYSSAEYIRVDTPQQPDEEEPVYTTDKEFEAYLTAQKFPEDYKIKLRQIWAKHPNWVFQAQHLSMTWKRALNEEAKGGKNAIIEPDSWKSMGKGAYDWKTGSYIEIDSGGWVNATKEVVAYFMDPRNFLDETYIFQFEDLQYSTHHTVAGIKAILPTKLDQYAEDLLKASKEAEVSAYFLATRMAQEGSQILGEWKGDNGKTYKVYNFFNYGAYAGSQHGSYHGAVTNGAIYAENQGWDTPYKCLYGSAVKIGNGYIHKGQNTLYLQKFNMAGENLYNHQYMTNVEAPSSEGQIRASSATEQEKKGTLTFLIPVYKSMPTDIAPLPGRTGNNNNFLDSITVKGVSISPTFDRYEQEYTGQVAGEVTSVQITAKKNASGATVKGTGTVKLKPGDNAIPLTVTATSGQTRIYTVIINRDAPQEPDTPDEPPKPPAPTLEGGHYTVDQTVTGVQPQTKVATFLKNLGVKNGTVALYDAAGKKKTDGFAATGDVLHVYDSEKTLAKRCPVVIYGDVNGDGKINSQDLRRAQRHILNVAKLGGQYAGAADVNKDEKINSQDLRRAQRYILGLVKNLQTD